MKRSILTLIIALASGTTALNAQIVNIPDANFKANLVGNTAINTNGDAEIQVSEATAFTGLIQDYSGTIADFTGLEAFVNLTQLKIGYHPITSIDVSQNTALTVLHVYINQLTSLGVSNNTALVELRCERNPIMTLDISTLTNLELLTCGNCGLTSLDLSNNPNLDLLEIGSSMSSLNVNQFTSLDLSNNLLLTKLYTTTAPLPALDLSNNINLTTLYCGSSTLSSLDVSMLPNLTSLSCGNNNLTSLNVSNNLALTMLHFGGNPTTGSFDLSNHTALVSLACQSTQISALNVANGNNTNFTMMMIYDNPNLTCVQVDDAIWATSNWDNWDNIDPTAVYSEDCSTVSISEINENTITNIYPNPSNSVLNIETEEFINILIVNLLGEIVAEQTLKSGNNRIDISRLTNGVYFIQSGKGRAMKFVKE